MKHITINDVAELLVPMLSIFTPHLFMIISIMIAFAIGKFTKDIIIK